MAKAPTLWRRPRLGDVPTLGQKVQVASASASNDAGGRGNRPARQDRRGSAHSRGYGARWRDARAMHLRRSPLCVCHAANGRTAAATLVDHVVPHRGDMALFWDSANWQSLCDSCHNSIKAELESMWDAGSISIADLRLDRLLPQFFP